MTESLFIHGQYNDMIAYSLESRAINEPQRRQQNNKQELENQS